MKKYIYTVAEHSIFCSSSNDFLYIGADRELAFDIACKASLNDHEKLEVGSDILIFCNHECIGFYEYGEFVPYKYANNTLQK
nr:MAG TPA: hypothetical protein [Caudoviricetes sp.]